MRSLEEIEAEIESLEACKSYAPHYTAFGEDESPSSGWDNYKPKA